MTNEGSGTGNAGTAGGGNPSAPTSHQSGGFKRVLKRLVPDPFILLLLSTVALASLFPAQGIAADGVDYLATAAIVLLFFFHGAKLSRSAILGGIGNWRLHLMILGTSFILFPSMGVGIGIIGEGVMPPALITGILFMTALPSTVQSSIAFTSMARGNVPAAIASASASQILGVFLTPLLILFMTHTASGGSFSLSSIGTVLLIVLLPFLAGHLSRPLIGEWVSRNKAIIGISDRSAILLSVYSAFSDAVLNGLWTSLPLQSLLILAGICIILLTIILCFTWRLARMAKLSTEDEITLIFCGSKKSLVQGIPMARVLFAGPDLGMILLPVMIFHQIQLMACAWIARRYARRPSNVQ